MKIEQKKKARSWGHRLREENSGLKEKIATLRKENTHLKKDLEKAWELMAHVPGGLFLLQQETIVYANDAASKWLGYSLGQLAGKSLMEIIDPKDVQTILDFIQDNAGNQRPDAVHFKNSEGRSVYCAVHIKKTRYEGRNAFLLNLIEIERKIEQEKAVLETRKFEALQRMAGAFVQGFGITEKPENPLSATLSDFSKKTYDPSELSPLNLNETIETSVSRYCSAKGINGKHNRNSNDQISLKTSLNATSLMQGCQEDLHKAFMNLIINAEEALEGKGEIYLTAEEKPGLINIYVQENGYGIHEKVADKIFDPFFSTKGNGHKGLGLSLVRSVMERHGGKIEVMRQKAGGTTFHIQLPLDHDRFKTSDRPQKKSIKDARILLLGDQNILINLLCRFLKGKHLHLTRVDSYGECFKTLNGNSFDLLLVDQNKSPANTAWLTQKVHHTHPDLPIALFNAPNTHDAPLSRPSGVDLVIPRPLHVESFYSDISRLLAEGKGFSIHT
ncbi:MAG: PAS domain-containing sensor histidine kinase [Deltaproteobacteria bacterium]|nr:PAS domain-containing sensor histidine kinase [Deltaproteobacteria bacterium]